MKNEIAPSCILADYLAAVFFLLSDNDRNRVGHSNSCEEFCFDIFYELLNSNADQNSFVA